MSENQNTYPQNNEQAEHHMPALAAFEALTSDVGVATERERLYQEVHPFLDESGNWDENRANSFYRFLRNKGDEYEQTGDENSLKMIRASREQFDRTVNDYHRYDYLLQDTPYFSMRIDDPRGLAILRAGEAAVPRSSNRQIFIPNEDTRFADAYTRDHRQLHMLDSNTLHRGTADIAVNRIVACAAPFASWTSGYKSGTKAEAGTTAKSDSAALIKDYATRDSEIPPLDEVYGLLTTDGALYYMVTGGAHRAAAAIMKGQETIAVKKIDLRKIYLSSADIESYGQ